MQNDSTDNHQFLTDELEKINPRLKSIQQYANLVR
jgi:hypothetical protein